MLMLAGGLRPASPFWSVPRQWQDETAFVIAGGPSVLSQNVEALRGRKVIVINSSCYCAPWADYLFFMDARWWRENRAGCDAFQGKLVTTAATHDPRALRLKKRVPEHGFASDPSEVTGRRSTVSLVLNALAHMGVARIVLLGVDGRLGLGGRRNHHADHKWTHRPKTWVEQRNELREFVKPLRERGIEVVNASPGSALPFWPIVKLEDYL